MNSRAWNGPPDALDDALEHEGHVCARPAQPFTCSDCGTTGLTGYCAVSVTNKVFCQDCKQRRGLGYLFDRRSWAEIAKALQRRSA